MDIGNTVQYIQPWTGISLSRHLDYTCSCSEDIIMWFLLWLGKHTLHSYLCISSFIPLFSVSGSANSRRGFFWRRMRRRWQIAQHLFCVTNQALASLERETHSSTPLRLLKSSVSLCHSPSEPCASRSKAFVNYSTTVFSWHLALWQYPYWFPIHWKSEISLSDLNDSLYIYYVWRATGAEVDLLEGTCHGLHMPHPGQ